ncbi:hypothetical protein [Hwangdonia lutea]|uniref:Cytochrome c domain-containing protein n=1 Tax=Hwangdonia lutea TaxID=3075823 RepID=A0AA97HQT0_9FLAO|nr:hypothetical protein [Hwangdonia sp. SCSIO 19198]WOD44281.1 hypothetical protein RNZ46_03235 [Hwangdonia sp. SCSIO 19198]
MKKVIISLGLTSLIFLGCTNTSTDDLIDKEALPKLITYNSDVKPIIDNNCIMCHSNPPVNGAPISLTTYTEVKNAVQINGLIGRISKQAGEAGAMPLGGPRLPQNLIDQIIQWQADGLLEQ